MSPSVTGNVTARLIFTVKHSAEAIQIAQRRDLNAAAAAFPTKKLSVCD
jgi:hypothetical protein